MDKNVIILRNGEPYEPDAEIDFVLPQEKKQRWDWRQWLAAAIILALWGLLVMGFFLGPLQ